MHHHSSVLHRILRSAHYVGLWPSLAKWMLEYMLHFKPEFCPKNMIFGRENP